MDFLCESANLALMMGNTSIALDLTGSAETSARGRDTAVPEAGTFIKLRAFRVAHLYGVEHARPIIETGLERFRGCHPIFFLELLAAKVWLERQDPGSLSEETRSDLALFDDLQARGLKATLTAQGFLT